MNLEWWREEERRSVNGPDRSQDWPEFGTVAALKRRQRALVSGRVAIIKPDASLPLASSPRQQGPFFGRRRGSLLIPTLSLGGTVLPGISRNLPPARVCLFAQIRIHVNRSGAGG